MVINDQPLGLERTLFSQPLLSLSLFLSLTLSLSLSTLSRLSAPMSWYVTNVMLYSNVTSSHTYTHCILQAMLVFRYTLPACISPVLSFNIHSLVSLFPIARTCPFDGLIKFLCASKLSQLGLRYTHRESLSYTSRILQHTLTTPGSHTLALSVCL